VAQRSALDALRTRVMSIKAITRVLILPGGCLTPWHHHTYSPPSLANGLLNQRRVTAVGEAVMFLKAFSFVVSGLSLEVEGPTRTRERYARRGGVSTATKKGVAGR
jgi:hypothetical protein